jgi:two-component system, OmpR family, heavy metal sensor histidine kinase CusS
MSSTTPAERTGGSLALRLTLWYTACAFTLILGATGLLYWSLARNLDREDDEFLADQVLILRGLLRNRPDDDAGIRQEVEFESEVRRHARVYLRILDGTGRVLAETPGMPPSLGPKAFPPPSPADVDLSRGTRFHATDGRDFRILAAQARLGTAGPPSRTLQVALDRREEDELLSDFREHALPVLVLSLFFSAVIGYRIARRGIRPVEEIASTARRIRSATLHERIARSDLPAELSGLAATINDMLDRLQASFDQLARFSADIAHELRTPLGNLRGEIEVALGRTRDPQEYRETLSSSLEEIGRLSQMVESLLFLARAENPKHQIQRDRVDLPAEIEDLREFYEAGAAEAGVTLRTEIAGAPAAQLDRDLLRRALGNLVENALAHTPRGGTVTLSAGTENGSLLLGVRDTGCGIAAEHLPRVFDRFYRADPSRTAATGGTGLGLAIVKSIAELHGGAAEIESEPGKGTRVRLRLPMTKS